MAGLLGSDMDDPRTQGLLGAALAMLAASGPSPVRRSLGQIVGMGGREGLEQYGVARRQKLLDEESRRRNELADLQIQQGRQSMSDAEARRAELARVRSLIADAVSPVSQQQAMAAYGGPTVAAADAVGRQKPIDAQRLIAAGVPIDAVKALIEAPNIGRPEVARTVEVDDGQGGKKTVQLDKYGRPVGEGMPGYIPPVQVNQGNRITFTRPQAGVSLPVGMNPAEQDASRRGWAGFNLSREDAETRRAEGGKPPPGYRWKGDGTLEAIPGGPADLKASKEGTAADERKRQQITSAQNVLGIVGDAKKLVGVSTAGVGGWAASIPATDARDLSAKLETIKANLGFDRLQQMREASPTGGALGQVAVQELTALQASVASLDQMQSVPQLRAALDRVERHYRNWLEVVQARTGRGGAGASWGGQQDAEIAAPTVIDWSQLPKGR